MSLRRFGAIVGLDARFHFRRPMFWILILLLGALVFGLAGGNVRMQSGDTSVGGEKQIWLTSEFSSALSLSMSALIFYTFFVAIAAGMAIPRDEELNVGPVLHSTRLRPSEYVFGKFVAVVLMFLGVVAAHVLLTVFFNHVVPTENAENIRGPLAWMNYVRPALVMIVPFVVFMAGTAFAIGTVTRNAGLVFLAPLVVFIVCPFLLWADKLPSWVGPRLEMLMRWVDPSGFRWLNETWIKVDMGVDYYNHTPIGYDVAFLLSRLALVLVGAGSVVLAERHFARTLRRGGATGSRLLERLRRRRPPVEPVVAEAGRGVRREPAIAGLGMRIRPPAFARTVLDVTKAEARTLATAPGLYMFAAIIIIQVVGSAAFETGPFGVPLLATSGKLAVGSLGLLTTVLCFLLLFYTAESVTRESRTRIAPMVWATPARTGAVLLGKALANGVVAAVILLAAGVGNLIVMAIQGKVAPDPVPFLIVWGGLLLPTVVLWATFVTALVALTNSRWATYGVALAVMMLTAWKNFRAEVNWVGNWSLWQTATWTDFGALDPNGGAYLLNRLFWLAVAGFLVVLTMRVFPRREFDSGLVLDRLRPAGIGRGVLRLGPAAIPAVVLGSILFVQVTNGFQGKAAERREKEYWGRNLATWMDADTPQLGGVDLDITLDPPAHSFEVTGTYALVNMTDAPMARFPMSVGDHFRDVEWTLGGEVVEPESHARLFVFRPDPPLAPGDTVQVGFSYRGALPDGPTKNGGGMSEFVMESGVVLTSFGTGLVPPPDFEEGRGIGKDNRMDPKDYAADYFEGITKPALGSGSRFPVRTTIRGPEAYEFHGVGIRRDDRVEDGVRTVVWESDHPVNFFNVVGSRDWERLEGDGVEIWHHPRHRYNLDEMKLALEGARRWYSEWFWPYPWRDLRVNEFPGIASYAQGFPTNITFSENIGFLTRDTDEVDAAFLVTAHESAHQWWGNILLPGEGPGGNVLSEGAAHFSTILLHRQLKGEKARREFCRRIEENYGEDRQVDSERPLPWLDGSKGGDTTAMYDRGGWVLWMLHELMGEEASLAGIRDFIGRYRESLDYPVLQDYVRVMREHAPDPAAYDAFVAQWVDDIVVPEYRLADVVKREADGAWVVGATVTNAGTGKVPVEVAVTAGERYGDDGGESADWKVAGQVVELAAGESTTVEIRADFEPEKLVVDPDVTVLMLKRKSATRGL